MHKMADKEHAPHNAGGQFRASKPIPIESVAVFLNREKPPLEFALEPILSKGGAIMVWGPTGIGKSRYGLALSFAIASGHSFLKYTAPNALRVLHIFAEMTEQEAEKMILETIQTGFTKSESLFLMHHKNVTHAGLRGIPKFGAYDWWDTTC